MSASDTDLLKQALTALRGGDLAAAEAASGQVLRSTPHDPRTHYVHARVAAARGDAAAAETGFAEAVRLAPAWPNGWVELGVAQFRRHRVELAKASLREALQLEPGHRAARALLVVYLLVSGETAAAEALLRETVALQPDNAGARLTLVTTLLHQERAAEALALLESASPPGDAKQARVWEAHRAAALVQRGRLDEARAAIAASRALGACPPAQEARLRWPAVLLARAEGSLAEAAVQARAMADALEPDKVPAQHKIEMCFDLGTFWAGQRQPAEAMRLWREAHRLLAPREPFSRSEHMAFLDGSIAALDRDRLTRGPRASNADPAPIFIVGMPRSGTTLCHQILAAHRHVHGAGERTTLAACFAQVVQGAAAGQAPERLAALGTAALDGAANDYLAALHALAPGRARIVDKMPGNYLLVGLIALMLPGARIVHCERDPRDIGLSIFSMRFDGVHPYAHDLADLGWTIGQQARIMAHWRAALPGMILAVKLSDWVTDFDATLERVLRHAGLPPDPACARFYDLDAVTHTASQAQVRRPVNAQGLGRWRPYAAELAPMIVELDVAGALAGW